MRNKEDWPYPEVEIMFRNNNPNWLETCERVYWDQLECLPPKAMKHSAFAVGEAWDSDRKGIIYAMFVEVGGLYFCKMDYIQNFNSRIYTQEVLNQIALEVQS